MKVYEKRRKRLMQMMGRNSVAILPAAVVHTRNRDIEYPYRQDSDFSYLTGFPEPEAVIVVMPGRRGSEFILFCQDRDELAEAWTGPRIGLEGACERYGAKDAYPIDDIDDILPNLLEDCDKVYYTMGCNAEFDHCLLDWVNQVRKKSRSGVHAPSDFVALDHLLNEMRLYKDRDEIKMIRKAVKISSEAHCHAMATCQPGMMEYQVEAEILYVAQKNGCRDMAYPSIVGGGENACVLHYTDNNAVLNDGDLLLIDAGAEYQGYAADITRTFPVNGRFSAAQKALYEVVLDAQMAAIEKAVPGNHWNEPHVAATRVLTRGLVKLGILKGQVRSLVKNEAYKPYYVHRTGHWMGMDVHDVGDYKVDGIWRLLEPGMVLTVEPGLYIPHGTRGVAKKWWGMGIRIEDDVLVTRKGNEVLSSGVPKTVDEIEALMAA